MNNTLLLKILENFQPLIADLKTPKLKAEKLRELLQKELKKNQNFDLISGTKKGLTEMFQEINKKELAEEIEIAIKLIEHFESTSTFGLINIYQDKFSSDISERFDIIKLELIKLLTENNSL